MAFTKAGLWGPDAVLDSAGHPQPGATAAVYLSDGVTLAGLWTSSAKSVALANPTQADIHGNLHFYADPGPYVLKVTVGGTVTTLTVEVPIDPGEAAQDQDVVAAQAAAEAYADGIVAAALAAALAASQPLDADLTAIAGLATTAFGRALLILADAAALRTAAGLGTAATHAVGDFDAAGTAAAAVAAVVAGAPGALDTLNELATALADDANFATTVTNALATKVIAGATSGSANQAALGAAVAHTHEIVKTDDGGVYLSTGSSWVEVVPPSLKLAPTAVKTGNYTAAVGDYVLCDTSGGIFTVTLPTAPADKTSIAVDLVASGSTLTIARGGADVFQKAGGPTSLTMNTANRVLVLQYQSSIAVWHVQDHLPAVITTKGDLLTYGTERARLAVGADGALLGADSTQATGLKWIPSGTYVPLNGTAGFTVESDGGSGQFITANPSVNDIDRTNNAKASAILASGQTGFPNRLGSGCQLCSIPGAYDVDINSGYSSGGTQNPLMNIVDSAHGRITGAGLVSHGRLTGGSYHLAQADAGQSTTYAMLRGTGTAVAVQTLTVTATGGTFTLRAGRRVTAAIAFNASAATIQTALNAALASAPSTTAAVTGTGPFTVTLTGNEGFLWADTSLLTGGTATLAIVSVPGPTAYSPGASLIAPVAEGYGTWAAASYSRAVGRQTKSAAQYSYAMGYRTIADLLGAVAHGSGAIATDGDVGVMHLTPFRQTTDGAAHRLCVDGAGGTLVTLLDNTAYAVYLECLAARTDSHSPVQMARFRIEGIVYRQSGVATVVWLPDTTASFDPQGTGVTLVASADTSGGAISFTATGIAAQTWNWSGYLRLTKAAF